jgi:glycosyltransferase involved in cell wall biosynthesis
VGVALAVVVPTRGRPVRLRWLLDALASQTAADFSVIVACSAGDPALDVVRDFASVTEVVSAGGPAALRNAAWRASSAGLIAFTDDDCRPPADWVAQALAAATGHPGAIVQGATHPDPDELDVFRRAPHARSQEIDPPHVMAQTCNIVYPRSVLEAMGGFDETFPQAVGEDTDLALRARAAGTPYVAAPDVLTFHAVETGLVRRLRGSWRWQHMALVVRRHPELRAELPLGGYAWKARHAYLALAAAGIATAARSFAPSLNSSEKPRKMWTGAGRVGVAAALSLPYLLSTPPRYGASPRALARTATELPGRALVDAVELAALLRGSARYRTFLL